MSSLPPNPTPPEPAAPAEAVAPAAPVQTSTPAEPVAPASDGPGFAAPTGTGPLQPSAGDTTIPTGVPISGAGGGGQVPPGGYASAPPPAPARSGPSRTLIGVIVGIVVLVGGFLALKAFSGGSSTKTVSSAQSSTATSVPGRGFRNGGGGAFGTLQSVDGTTLTIAERNGGTTAVITSSSTRIVKSVPGAVSDVKVGDRIVARGTSEGTDTVTAESISDMGTATAFGPGGPGGQGRVRGNGNGNGGPGGQGAQGGPNFNGGNPPNGGNGPNGANGTAAGGEVTGVNGSVVTVKAGDGSTKTINTTSSTTVSVLEPATLQDLTVGQQVTAFGTTNSDGTVTAQVVQQGDRLGGGRFFGPPGGGNGGPPDTGGGTGTDNPTVN